MGFDDSASAKEKVFFTLLDTEGYLILVGR